MTPPKIEKKEWHIWNERCAPNVIAGDFTNGKQKVINAEYVEALEQKCREYEEALKFECGNRCSEQNPCSAKEALMQVEQIFGGEND